MGPEGSRRARGAEGARDVAGNLYLVDYESAARGGGAFFRMDCIMEFKSRMDAN